MLRPNLNLSSGESVLPTNNCILNLFFSADWTQLIHKSNVMSHTILPQSVVTRYHLMKV